MKTKRGKTKRKKPLTETEKRKQALEVLLARLAKPSVRDTAIKLWERGLSNIGDLFHHEAKIKESITFLVKRVQEKEDQLWRLEEKVDRLKYEKEKNQNAIKDLKRDNERELEDIRERHSHRIYGLRSRQSANVQKFLDLSMLIREARQEFSGLKDELAKLKSEIGVLAVYHTGTPGDRE
jgi:TolA-binding protein